MKFSGSITGLLDAEKSPTRMQNGIPVFLSSAKRESSDLERTERGENLWKNFFKRWPALYDTLVFLIAPCFFTGLTPKKFIAKFVSEGMILNAGSGVKRLSDRCVNVDLFAFPGVDLVSDLTALPFRRGAFDAVTCDQVLEHVGDPHAVCRELLRVTKPGGLIHIAFLTGLRNRFSTLATWLGSIARARRTDRTFALGSTTSPEHPYTWLKFAHPNMLDPKRDSTRDDPDALKHRGGATTSS